MGASLDLPPPCPTPRRHVDALDDRECANILLVNGTIRGDISCVKRALSQGAAPDTVAGLTLQKCVRESDTAAVKKLTPLMRACSCGHKEIITCLLEARASLNLRDSHGWSALCYAFGAGELAIARHLLSSMDPAMLTKERTIIKHNLCEIVSRCSEEWECDLEKMTSVREALDRLITPLAETENHKVLLPGGDILAIHDETVFEDSLLVLEYPNPNHMHPSFFKSL